MVLECGLWPPRPIGQWPSRGWPGWDQSLWPRSVWSGLGRFLNVLILTRELLCRTGRSDEAQARTEGCAGLLPVPAWPTYVRVRGGAPALPFTIMLASSSRAQEGQVLAVERMAKRSKAPLETSLGMSVDEEVLVTEIGTGGRAHDTRARKRE